ncbi:MAG TPA: peroxide stress protein YaaA, partial [Pseudonocardiaceae bacterium]|nr:peroxide stress protein YaaA [Pseudonocardiaceae bacterium]
ALAGDVPGALAALGLSEHQSGDLERNAALWTTPTLPALHRYTGVLYAALDAGSLRRTERARAGARLAVASALFGLLAADDPIPAYRLSASSLLPAVGTVRSVWRLVLPPLLVGVAGLVVDLRSGAYAALGPLPGAVTVHVLSKDGHGRRRAVSHHNKALKGRLARLLATAPREVSDADGVAGLPVGAGCRWSAPASTRWISSSRPDPPGGGKFDCPPPACQATLYLTTAGTHLCGPHMVEHNGTGGGGRPWLPVVCSST